MAGREVQVAVLRIMVLLVLLNSAGRHRQRFLLLLLPTRVARHVGARLLLH
jgi:hypothetical protein